MILKVKKAKLVQINNRNNDLIFKFEYSDGTIEILDSFTTSLTVMIDGHYFGKYEK